MEQCLTVLNRLQPLTRERWESECYEDLRKQSCCCLSLDMSMALSACVRQGYVIEGPSGYFLAEPLEPTLKKLDAWCKEGLIANNKRDEERKQNYREWVDALDLDTVKPVLLQHLEEDVCGHDGRQVWETLWHFLDWEIEC